MFFQKKKKKSYISKDSEVFMKEQFVQILSELMTKSNSFFLLNQKQIKQKTTNKRYSIRARGYVSISGFYV